MMEYNISNETSLNLLNEQQNYNIINITNLFRLIFYTPIIFVGSVMGSIIYDYITFNEEKNNNKKLD
jgi:hypothetical protein